MSELEISRIHDAYAAGGECPICSVMSTAEDTYVRSFRGGRVMAPEVRVATNRSGFCPAHYERLYRGEGKLGLSLMVHTHLAESVPLVRASLQRCLRDASGGRRGRRALGGRRAGAAGRLADTLTEMVSRCFICDMLAGDLERYCFTVLYLWQRDPEFPATLARSRGFCLPHYAALLRKGEQMLRAEELSAWLATTAPLVTGSLERLERQVHEFTQRYHHAAGRAADEEARTALSRALQKLSGRALRLERGLEPGVAVDQDQDRLTGPGL